LAAYFSGQTMQSGRRRMKDDRTLRRLTAMARSASTARVLNLIGLHNRMGEDPAFTKAPLFRNRLLDRSIVVKHRLRPHEAVLFPKPPKGVKRIRTATKLLIPIDGSDLNAGARFVFVGQRDFDSQTQSVFGAALKPGGHDRRVLDLIAELPSLDPFLLREHLKRHEVEPSRVYFGVSDADSGRMHEFVRGEVMALVAMSSRDPKGLMAYTQRLVDKLLSSAPETGFEPLKDTLKLSDEAYLDGVFAWRGFLYYKWILGDLQEPMGQVCTEIAELAARGPRDVEAIAYLPDARNRIVSGVGKAYDDAQAMIAIYDRAYGALTRDSQPMAFRDFLLQAPDMFTRLGEQLGAIQHIVSFWRYRFQPGEPRTVSPTELMDLLMDFEDSLEFSPEQQDDHAWVA
jgi:hypothetical protein